MKGLHLPVASTHAPSQHQAMPVLKCDCLRYAVMCLCSGPSLIISRWQTRVICFVTMLRITSTVSNGSFSEMSACRREPKIRPCCRGARNALQLATSKCCISLVSGPKRYVDKSDCGQFFPSNVAKLKPSQRVTVSSVVTLAVRKRCSSLRSLLASSRRRSSRQKIPVGSWNTSK